MPHPKTQQDVLPTELVLADPEVIPIEPGNSLYDWIKKLGNLLAGSKTLF